MLKRPLLFLVLACLSIWPVSASADPAGSPPSLDLSKQELARMDRGRTRIRSYGLELAVEASSPFRERQHTDATGGLGYEINFYKSLANRVALRLTYGRSGLNEGDYSEYEISDTQKSPLPPHLIVFQHRTELKATRYFIGIQYQSRPLDLQFTSTRFHFYGGLGVVNHKTTLVEDYYNIADSTSGQFVDRASITRFANTLGGGVILMFTRYTGIALSLGFDLVHAGQETDFVTLHSSRHYRAYNYEGTTNLRIGLIVLL